MVTDQPPTPPPRRRGASREQETQQAHDDAASGSGESFTTVATSTRNAPAFEVSCAVGHMLRERLAATIMPLADLAETDDSVSPDDSVSHAGLESRTAAVPLVSLSAQEVTSLLHAVELGRYASSCASLPMRGADLDAADEADLKEAGVTAAVHRRSLLRQIASWRAEGVPSCYLEHRSTQSAVAFGALPPASFVLAGPQAAQPPTADSSHPLATTSAAPEPADTCAAQFAWLNQQEAAAACAGGGSDVSNTTPSKAMSMVAAVAASAVADANEDVTDRELRLATEAEVAVAMGTPPSPQQQQVPTFERRTTLTAYARSAYVACSHVCACTAEAEVAQARRAVEVRKARAEAEAAARAARRHRAAVAAQAGVRALFARRRCASGAGNTHKAPPPPPSRSHRHTRTPP
jgi:hypothetical protein